MRSKTVQTLRDVSAFLWVTPPSCGYMGNGRPDPGFSCSVAGSDSLRPHGVQHARPTCPSPTPGAYSHLQETRIPSLGWEDPLEKGKAYPLQYSGLENSMDCVVYGVSESWTRQSDFQFHIRLIATTYL